MPPEKAEAECERILRRLRTLADVGEDGTPEYHSLCENAVDYIWWHMTAEG